MFKRLAARVRAVVVGQLVRGASPRALALTVALGLVLGTFPILGATTLLCGLAAWALRLNQPVIQVVNFVLAYPLHVVLLIPFYAAGQRLFGEPAMALTVGGLTRQFHRLPVAEFVAMYGLVALRGVVVWALLAGPATALLYALVRPVVERLARHRGVGPAPGGAGAAVSPPPVVSSPPAPGA